MILIRWSFGLFVSLYSFPDRMMQLLKHTYVFCVFIVCYHVVSKNIIPKYHSSYIFPCNTFFFVHLVEDEKASHPRIF